MFLTIKKKVIESFLFNSTSYSFGDCFLNLLLKTAFKNTNSLFEIVSRVIYIIKK